MRVHEPYVLQSPCGSWAPFDPAEDATFKEQEQAYLDTITKRLGKTASLSVTSALVDGLIEDGILKRGPRQVD